MTSEASSIEKAPTLNDVVSVRTARTFRVELLHWMRLLWPVILIPGVGAAVFGDAILQSVHSTQHPALIYVIFAVAAVAVSACVYSVGGYLKEARIASRWLIQSDRERLKTLGIIRKGSLFYPIYRVLHPGSPVASGNHHAIVSAEMEVAHDQMESKLEFPNFLGGSLVGLGLVGTFIGLLGTLDDLSRVFSALVNSGGSAMSPTEMFADMVSRLQAPMSSMGTAFVSSLYGLLGSMMISLMIVSAKKSSDYAIKQVHLVIRQSSYGGVRTQDVRPDVAALTEDQCNVQMMLLQLKEFVDQAASEASRDRQHHVSMAGHNAEMVAQMLSVVHEMREQQSVLQQRVHEDLQGLREVLQGDRANLMALLQSTRVDATQTLAAIEACRQSFDQGARGMRAVLAFLGPVSDSDRSTNSSS